MRISAKLSWYQLATAGLLTASLAACGSSPAPQPKPAGSPENTGMCATSAKKNGIEHCTKLFPGNEPIRLPADPSATQTYGAMTRSGTAFHTRTGDLPLAPTMRDKLNRNEKSGEAEYANAIYLATIANGTVTDVKPVALIDENAIVGAFFAGRAMEGTIAAQVQPGVYGGKPLPIRIEFVKDPANGKLKGRFVNATTGIRGADGTCIQALPKQGNPFTASFTPDIQLSRFPGMHTIFDDELLINWNDSTSNMGSGYYPSVATLLGGDPLDKEWKTGIHGTPTAGPAVDVHLVTGGGGTC
jgi:hypothetical protein